MADIALHYDRRPSGSALVLLPPFPLDSRIWYAVREILQDLPVVVADPPGFGDSVSPTSLAHRLGVSSYPSLDTYAKGLALALDEIGVEKVVLAGVSMGGYTALAFAELFRERLLGIGLLDTNANADSTDKRENRLKMADALEEGMPTSAFMEAQVNMVVSPRTPIERAEVYEKMENWHEQAPAAGLIWAQRAMAARPSRLHVLQSLAVPGLVLRGAEDAVSTPESAEAMAAALGTTVVEVPRAGHMAAAEEPEIVAAALRDLWVRANAEETAG